MSDRVESTSAARDLLDALWQSNGPLLIHQSGGCCDGSVPMCLSVDEFRLGGANVQLGEIALDEERSVAVWVSESEERVWAHSTLVLDVEPGRAAGFSLEGSSGQRFVSRVRVTNDGAAESAACALPPS